MLRPRYIILLLNSTIEELRTYAASIFSLGIIRHRYHGELIQREINSLLCCARYLE